MRAGRCDGDVMGMMRWGGGVRGVAMSESDRPIDRSIYIYIYRERATGSQAGMQTCREAGRQSDRVAKRQIDTETGRHGDGGTERLRE